MKKLFTVLTVLLSMTQLSFSQTFMNVELNANAINTTTTANLKGDVESVTIKVYYASEQADGTLAKNGFDKGEVCLYNTNGVLIQKGCTDIYLRGDSLVNEAWNTDQNKKAKFIYNPNYECVGIIYYEADKQVSKSKCKVDNSGNIIKELNTNVTYNPPFNCIYTYTYNQNGIRTGYSAKDSYGTVMTAVKYELDENNNPIKEISYDEMSGENTATYKYTKFDDYGNWIECIYDKGWEKSIYCREIEYRK